MSLEVKLIESDDQKALQLQEALEKAGENGEKIVVDRYAGWGYVPRKVYAMAPHALYIIGDPGAGVTDDAFRGTLTKKGVPANQILCLSMIAGTVVKQAQSIRNYGRVLLKSGEGGSSLGAVPTREFVPRSPASDDGEATLLNFGYDSGSRDASS